LQLAATAKQLNPGIVIGFLVNIVAGTKLEPESLGTRHFVFRPKLHPFSARADAILLVVVGTQSTSLGVYTDRRDTASAKNKNKSFRDKRNPICCTRFIGS